MLLLENPYVIGPIMAASFGGYIESIRLKRGLSQRQLAFKAGVTPATVSKIEDGLVGASPEMVKKLADALEIDSVEVFRVWSEDAAASQGVDLSETSYEPDPELQQAQHLMERMPTKTRRTWISMGELLIDEDAIGASERNEERSGEKEKS